MDANEKADAERRDYFESEREEEAEARLAEIERRLADAERQIAALLEAHPRTVTNAIGRPLPSPYEPVGFKQR